LRAVALCELECGVPFFASSTLKSDFAVTHSSLPSARALAPAFMSPRASDVLIISRV
jgi:hypothetical protein